MNKREKILAIVTGVVVVLGAAVFFMPQGGLSLSSVSGDDLEQERRTFKKYARTLDDQKTIRNRYQQIGQGVLDTRQGQTPSQIFTNDLVDLISVELGIAAPDVEPAEFTPIKDVDEYEFVEIQAEVTDTLKALVKLLRVMDERGLLITEFKLTMLGSRRHADLVQMRFTVARLVKRQKQSIPHIRRRRMGG